MENASDHLTGLVLAVEYVIDPEAICFGGRLSDRILSGLMERVAKQVPSRRAGGGSENVWRESRSHMTGTVVAGGHFTPALNRFNNLQNY